MKRIKDRGLIGLMLIVALAVMMLIGTVAQATEYWKQKYVRFSAVAGYAETLSTGDVVYIATSDGRVYQADGDAAGKRPAVGIIDKGGTAGNTVEVVVMGVLAGQTDASPGKRVFLSTTAAAISTTAPSSHVQPVGWVLPGTLAVSSDYFIKIDLSVASPAAY